MCSTPKSSGTTPLKKVPTAMLTSSDFSDYVSVANAAEERKKEVKREAKARLLREQLSCPEYS